MEPKQIITLSVVSLALVLFIIVVLRPWIKAWSSGVHMSVMEVIFMKFRGTPPNLLIEVAMTLKHSGSEFSYQDLEVTYIAEKFNISSPKDLYEKYKEKINSREPEDREEFEKP